jgi:hypothetical protein
MASRLLPTICAIGALGIVSACAIDSASAPPGTARASSAMTSAAFAGDLGRTKQRTVLALSRDLSLQQDVSATATIGVGGGTLVIREAGVAVVFPPGAVRSLTRITMTAKAGSAVAYEFEPHGLTFDAPVRVEQDLTYTDIKRGQLARIQAGYYQQTLDAIFVNLTTSLARVTELRDVDLDDSVNPRIATFYISHFSGYIMSSGFADGGGSDTPFPQH